MLSVSHAHQQEYPREAQPAQPIQTLSHARSKQPDIPEQEDNSSEEGHPDLPADAGALRHAEHAVHGTAQAHTSAIERVVHLLGERGRITDFVADGQCDLR